MPLECFGSKLLDVRRFKYLAHLNRFLLVQCFEGRDVQRSLQPECRIRGIPFPKSSQYARIGLALGRLFDQ